MPRLKLYRVVFTDQRYMRIELKARSAPAAIKLAEALYLQSQPDDPRFVDWGGEPFDDAEAEEVCDD
jgi:hypothetical protein